MKTFESRSFLTNFRWEILVYNCYINRSQQFIYIFTGSNSPLTTVAKIMKRIIFIFIFILWHITLQSQTVIAKQSFEASGDTWTPLNFSTPPCTVGNDVWDYTTSLPSIAPNEGAQFWGIRDLNGSCGGNDFETIIFPNVNVSSFTDVSFSFDYNAINFDNGEDLKYELFYDGVSQGEVIVVDGVGGGSDNTNGWLTETVSIPDTVNNVSVILSARCSANNERAGFDNVILEEVIVTLDDCAGAVNLTVYDNGTSGGNETAANSATATASSMSDTTCDSFTSNENLDLFYTFTVPASATSINVLTAGANGATINVAAWTACNGTEIFCDNTNSSFHEITGLTPGQTYVLQVWHDDFNAGPFTIALEGPTPPPANSGCSDSVSLTVGTNNTENIVTGTNQGASDSGELPSPSCAFYGGRDVWYTAEVPASGVLFVETQDAGSSIDTAMAIYTGSCGSLTQIACDDDSGPGLFSAITVTGLPNTTVYIRIYSYNNQSAGEFDIVAYSPECPFTTTWNGSSWNNGTPNIATSAIINGNYDSAINGDFESCDCTINSGTTVNIRANDYMLVQNDLSVSGILEVRHEGSLVMVEDDGVIASSGTINVHKTSSLVKENDYIYWTSPMSNETIGDGLASSIANRIYEWNTNAWFGMNASDIMEPGKGYIAQGPNSGTFPQNQSVIFDGVPNTGVVLAPVVLGPAPDLTGYDWNLIGNPYPSALDATKFLDDPLNSSVIGGTIYLWTHNTAAILDNGGEADYSRSDYATYTSGTGGVAASSGGDTPTGFIASGQGFFIEALATSNATLNNSMRANTNNDQFFKSSVPDKKEEEKDRVWLNLYNTKGAFSQLLVGFIDGATDGIDRSFDGPKLGGNYISFYSVIENENFAIQGKPPINDEATVQLGLYSYIEQGDSLSIGIDKIEGNLTNYKIYVNDKLLNIVHDLGIDDYTFVPEPESVYNERFELFLTKIETTLSADEVDSVSNELLVLNQENEIQIKTSNSSTITKLKIYDVLGKTIVNTDVNSTSYIFKTENISPGTIFIVNATLADDTVFVKKILID